MQIPAILSRSPFMLGDIRAVRRRGLAIAVVIVVALIAYPRYQRRRGAARGGGRHHRYSMGIDVRRVIAFTWVIAAITGCIAAC